GGSLDWVGTGTNTNNETVSTLAADFTSGDSIDLTEPDYDGDGVGTLVANPNWSTQVGQIKIKLTDAQTATDYDEIDWIAIGRPSPGASNAALLKESKERATADIAEATSRQIMSVQLVGDPDPGNVTINNISSGLL